MIDQREFELAHDIHPYPCKFPGSVAREFSLGDGTVLDPFCGSGTTLLETLKLGGTAIGIDCNPIALLITKCKVTNYSQDSIKQLKKLNDKVSKILDSDRIPPFELHEFPGRDHWFQENVQLELALILKLISALDPASIEYEASRMVLSSIVNRVSNQESETRYAAISKNFTDGEVLEIFQKKLEKFISIIHKRGNLPSQKFSLLQSNFVGGVSLAPGSIDRIVTSPPYANTMDYYLYHKQRMNILGYSFRDAMDQEIGSRHEFSSKKAAPGKWFSDFGACVAEMYTLLKRGGVAIIVIGDSQIAGKKICALETTTLAAEAVGFKVAPLSATDMSGRSRSFSASFQRPGKTEYVIELKK